MRPHTCVYIYITQLKDENFSPFSVLSAACWNTAVLWRLKAVTKHEIQLQYVSAALFCPCKHKSYIVKVPGIMEQPLITASVKQLQCNANVMSWKNDYISPAKFYLIWDKRAQRAINSGHLAALPTVTITCRFWPIPRWLLHVTGEQGTRRSGNISSTINKPLKEEGMKNGGQAFWKINKIRRQKEIFFFNLVASVAIQDCCLVYY